MSSNNNHTLPDAALSSQNRVSLDGGAADDITSGPASRKRKQQELDSITPETVASLSDPTIVAANAADNTAVTATRTDEQEITLIVTTRLLSDNVEDVAEAMASLQKLVFPKSNVNFDDNRKTAFRRGAPLAVVQAMRRNANSHKIQIDGIGVLSEISCCKLDKFQQDIIAVGGLTRSLEAMKRHDNNSLVQAFGCLLIGNLWWLPVVRKKVVDEGGLKAVVKAMEENENDAEVQHFGCFALETLTTDPESTWAKVAVDAGSIDLVIAAMNNHADEVSLQRNGCYVLSTLADAHKDYRIMILDAKGLVPVVEAQRIHKNDANLVHDARDAYDSIIAN